MEKTSLFLCFLAILVVSSFQASTGFKLTKPRLHLSISNGSPVYGVATVNDSLYVIRENSSFLQLYDVSNPLFASAGALEVLKKAGYFDMAYLPKRNKLVLLNWFNSYEFFVLDLDPPYELRAHLFTTTLTTAAVSTTASDDGNDDLIVLTESATKTVKVFTPDGLQVLLFRLLISRSPRQAVRLPGGLYAVGFGYDQSESHYLCRFNARGYIVGRCFGGRPGSGLTSVNVPSRMILTSDKKFLLLADMRNSRILKLPLNLTSAEVLLDSTDGVSYPYRLELDEKNGYLYVAENQLDSRGYAVSGKVNVYKF